MARSLLFFLCAVPLIACAGEATGEDEDGGEPASDEAAVVAMTATDETAPASALAPQNIDHDSTDLLDIRGVGDSGWSKTHERTALQAQFGAALDRFDASGNGYRGDLSFINWETVVGNTCSRFGTAYSPGRSYAFVSRPENLTQAYERGFNLIGLSNNHTRDCHGSEETSKTGEAASPDMTEKAIASVAGDKSWLTAGIGEASNKAVVRTFTVKGKQVRVAFGSLYTGRPDCPAAACSGDADSLFASLRDAQADVRILAMHSMAAADQDTLVKKGIDFVERYNGDVVFGHGPHVWKPVRVVKKSNGSGKGVIFESLGNFIHPSLGAQSKNFIGRALFDLESKKLKQVQILPIANTGGAVTWSSSSASSIESNLRWTKLPESQTAVYANVKE